MAEEEVQEGKKGGLGGIKLIVIVAVAVVVVGAGGFFLGKMLSGSDPVPEKPKTEDVTEKKDPSQNGGEQGELTQEGEPRKNDGDALDPSVNSESDPPGLLVLEKFTVNLNDPFGRRYAEILINLKLDHKSMVTKIQSHELILPQIRDEIFMIISSKSYPELNSVAGKITLKEEIMIRVNELIKESLGQEPVQDVFFGTFIIQ